MGKTMTIAEWNRIETLITQKFGWDKGLKKMVHGKNKISKKWLEDFNEYEDRRLKHYFRKLGL